MTPGLTLNSSNHTLWARTTIVLSYKPGSPSGPAGLCGISIGGRACSNSLPQALLHQRRDLPHRMILHLYKAISTSIVVWNAMGKIKKTNADKTQQGSNRWAGPMQSSVFSVCLFVFVFFFFCLFFFLFLFFPFSPSIGYQKNEKGSGRYRRRRRRERKREERKKKKEKRERGEGGGKNLSIFAFFFFFFFFFKYCVVYFN